ncbi:transcriptional regulator SinR [Barrientosiimonas marina]|uniref:Helix-turn-helix domain-containing protein n=1 Tax=Lentibacillus kimchii TaxID=1542911 RepID=A0ABW2UWX4_9BACI
MIGAKIRQMRQARGMSLSELAEEASVAKSYLSAIERNLQTNPSILFVEKISMVLDVSVDILIRKDANIDSQPLDSEWLQIFRDARDSGVPKERLEECLAFYKWRDQQS